VCGKKGSTNIGGSIRALPYMNHVGDCEIYGFPDEPPCGFIRYRNWLEILQFFAPFWEAWPYFPAVALFIFLPGVMAGWPPRIPDAPPSKKPLIFYLIAAVPPYLISLLAATVASFLSDSISMMIDGTLVSTAALGYCIWLLWPSRGTGPATSPQTSSASTSASLPPG
jgi:hypothetical protein